MKRGRRIIINRPMVRPEEMRGTEIMNIDKQCII
jgi:hypothetical protein